MKLKINDLRKLLLRREVVAFFLVVFLVSGFYTVKLMGASPYVVTTHRLGSFRADGILDHSAYLKPNNLYGNVTSRDEYPAALVNAFDLNYRFRTSPTTTTGNYTISGTAVYYVTRGKTKVVLWKEPLFTGEGTLKNGGFTANYRLDLGELNNRSSEISKELGINRLNRQVMITVNVSTDSLVGGKPLNEEFSHNMELVKDGSSGLYYFTNPTQTKTRSVTENEKRETYIRIFGKTARLKTAKAAMGATAFLSFLPIMGYLYAGKKPHDNLAGLRQYIVEGRPDGSDRMVELESVDDLKATVGIVDRPLIHHTEGDDEVYSVVDGDIVYEYRERGEDKGGSPEE